MNSRLFEQMKRAYGQQLVTVTIAAGTAVSTAIDLTDRVAYSLSVEVIPPWTDADIAVQVSEDGSTWAYLYDEEATRVMIDGVSTSSRCVYIFDRDVWAIKNYRYVRLESINTSTTAPVNQVSACTLRVGILS